jgi:hypothetical protein
VSGAFTACFGDRARPLPRQSASEDFSDIATTLGAPYTYWGVGGIDPETYHAATFAPAIGNSPSTPAPRPWSQPRSPGYDLARPRDRRRLRRLGMRWVAQS